MSRRSTDSLLGSTSFLDESSDFARPSPLIRKDAESPTLCPFCAKDLSHLSASRQAIHSDRCARNEEVSTELAKETKLWVDTIDCPLCKVPLQPGPFRTAHVKKCAKENNVPAANILKLVDTQATVAKVRRSKNLPHTKAPKPNKSRIVKSQEQKTKKESLRPKSAHDEQMQLALALSMSASDDDIQKHHVSPFFAESGSKDPTPPKAKRRSGLIESSVELAAVLDERLQTLMATDGLRPLTKLRAPPSKLIEPPPASPAAFNSLSDSYIANLSFASPLVLRKSPLAGKESDAPPQEELPAHEESVKSTMEQTSSAAETEGDPELEFIEEIVGAPEVSGEPMEERMASGASPTPPAEEMPAESAVEEERLSQPASAVSDDDVFASDEDPFNQPILDLSLDTSDKAVESVASPAEDIITLDSPSPDSCEVIAPTKPAESSSRPENTTITLDTPSPTVPLASPSAATFDSPGCCFSPDFVEPHYDYPSPEPCPSPDFVDWGASQPLPPPTPPPAPLVASVSCEVMSRSPPPKEKEKPPLVGQKRAVAVAVAAAESAVMTPKSRLVQLLGPGVKVLKTTNITPLPDFDAMASPALKCELLKNGIRPLPKKRAVKILRKVYEATHPEIAGPLDLDDGSSEEGDDGDDPRECLEESFLPGDELEADTAPGVFDSLMDEIRKNSPLFQRILLFEVIKLEEILAVISAADLKIPLEKLKNFLDEQCVTWTYDVNPGRKPGPRRPFRPKRR